MLSRRAWMVRLSSMAGLTRGGRAAESPKGSSGNNRCRIFCFHVVSTRHFPIIRSGCGVVHMWTAPSLQDVCSALIGSLASICPACGCART